MTGVQMSESQIKRIEDKLDLIFSSIQEINATQVGQGRDIIHTNEKIANIVVDVGALKSQVQTLEGDRNTLRFIGRLAWSGFGIAFGALCFVIAERWFLPPQLTHYPLPQTYSDTAIATDRKTYSVWRTLSTTSPEESR